MWRARRSSQSRTPVITVPWFSSSGVAARLNSSTTTSAIAAAAIAEVAQEARPRLHSARSHAPPRPGPRPAQSGQQPLQRGQGARAGLVGVGHHRDDATPAIPWTEAKAERKYGTSAGGSGAFRERRQSETVRRAQAAGAAAR